jgi:hypothetical protein
MLAGLASIQEARAQAPAGAPLPTFVDASRRADLRGAWAAANAKTDTETSRDRAESLSSRFAAEPPVQQAPAVVVPTETASIDKAPTPPASPPSVEQPQKPAASPVAATDDDKSVAGKRRKRIKRLVKRPKPQPTVHVATSKEELPPVPEESGARGPAGRLSTDYENWNLFPAPPSN